MALVFTLEFIPTTVAFAALAWTELSEPITTANGDAAEAPSPIAIALYASAVVFARIPAVIEKSPCAPADERTEPPLVLKLSSEGGLSRSVCPLFTWK